MILAWMIYLIGIVDRISMVSGTLCFLAPISSLVCFMAYGMIMERGFEQSDIDKKIEKTLTKLIKACAIVFIISLSLYSMTPNSKTLAAMYVIPAVANNEKVQSIGKNGLELLDELTTQWLKELKDTKDQKRSTKEDI